MPQSLAHVLLHLVFSTKNRAPFLQSRELREELHGYVIGTLQSIDCPSLVVRTVDDQLHCLLRLSRTMSIATLVENMKVQSSAWVKGQAPQLADFYWQSGYGAFSVSMSNVEQVKAYIANQEEHNRRMSFQDEFRALLRRHEMEFDERYVWN